MLIQRSVVGTKCPNCGGRDFILRNGNELVCVKCGHVLITHGLEEGPEWRSFEGDGETKVRVGMPPSLMMQDKGLSTVIGRENEDSAGRKIVGKAKRDLDRLRRWQRRIASYDSRERNLSQALGELNRTGEQLNIPFSVMERASYYYRLAMEKDLIRGRSIKNLATAALYLALRIEGIPKKKEVAKNYRLLVKELKLRMPTVDPAIYVKKICSKGSLGKAVMLQATKIVRLAQDMRLTVGKDPVGLASAAVYYACELLNVEKSQRDIALAADVTEVTVRNRYKSLNESLNLKEPL
jgi:transcription initiation factor TFIIB